jgi:hypothetical protein
MKQMVKFIVLFMFLFTCGKKMEDYKTTKVECNAEASAADGYECLILSGSSLGDVIIPTLPVNSSWGASSKVWVIGDGFHITPDTIYIDYYSLVDDKFYRGIHPLDQQELYRLLTTVYIDLWGKTLRYYSFTVSVAPCGLVGVWIKGSAGSLEICQFRAQEINLDFEKEYKVIAGIGVTREENLADRKYLYPFIQKEIAENRILSEYWERLSKKYRWKLTINDHAFEVYNYSVDLINKERYYKASNSNRLIKLNEKAIPSEFCIYLKHDKDPLRYKVLIELVKPWDTNDPDDEKQVLAEMNRNRELMDIFDRFYAEAGDEEVSLLLELNESMTSATLKLKTATKEQEIEGCNLYGIFESDRYNLDD